MTLINGHCLEEMKDMSDNSIDFLFADLPYGQTTCKWDCLIDLSLFWKQVNRICKQEAVMAFTCSVKFGNSLINSNPKCFRYDLVWVKSAACGFLNAKKMPMKKHEMVYIFYRKLPKVYTENIALHHTHKFLKQENEVIKTNLYSSKTAEKPRELYRNEGGQYTPPLPNSILEIKSEKGKHATQKPIPLMEWLIKYYTREGDVVLDPTMGSGGTGIACKNLNRQFIGIEKDEEIYNVAVLRNKI